MPGYLGNFPDTGLPLAEYGLFGLYVIKLSIISIKNAK